MYYLVKYRIFNNETEKLEKFLYKSFSSKEDVTSFLDNIRKDNQGEFIIYKLEHCICDDVFDVL